MLKERVVAVVQDFVARLSQLIRRIFSFYIDISIASSYSQQLFSDIAVLFFASSQSDPILLLSNQIFILFPLSIDQVQIRRKSSLAKKRVQRSSPHYKIS